MLKIHSIKDHIPIPTWAEVYSGIINELSQRKDCKTACGIVRVMERKELMKNGR